MAFDVFETIESFDSVSLVWGIRLIPDQADHMVSLAKTIEADQLVDYSVTQEPFPFIRLYEAIIPEHNLNKAETYFQALSTSIGNLTIQWGTLEETENQVILWTQEDDYLQAVQLSIMTAMNPLREGKWEEKYSITHLDMIERDSVRTWGWSRGADLHPFVVIVQGSKKIDVAHLGIEWPYRKMHVAHLFMAKKLHHRIDTTLVEIIPSNSLKLKG